MNFTYEGADLSKTIKSYNKIGDYHKIEYLDGSTSSFYCTSKEEEEKIKKEMINQAIDRQNNMNLGSKDRERIFNRLLFAISSVETVLLIKNKKDFLSFLTLLTAVFCESIILYRKETLKELKKYKLFLEMIDDVDTINNSQFLKCIEFENIYQKPYGIDTLDDYSYGELKVIKHKLKKVKSNR